MDTEFNIYELIGALFIALCYVGCFCVQRTLDRKYYFGFGEIIYGLRTSIKPLSFLIKVVITLVLAVLFFILSNNSNMVILGIFIGSFLLVWPAILDPFYYPDRKYKKILLYCIYILYILISTIISHLGINIVIYLQPYIQGYVTSWHEPTRMIIFIIDGFLFLIFTSILVMLLKILDKDIPNTFSDRYE